MTSMRDVAAEASVSIGTVSRVINGSPNVAPELEERVQKAIDALQYRPNAVARSLRKRRSRTLGLVIPDITNPYFAELAGSIESAALAAGYRLILGNSMDSAETEKTHISALLDHQVDGLILAPAVATKAVSVNGTLPLVLVDRSLDGTAADLVTSDNREGGRLAAQHLVALGHRRIAVISGPTHLTVAEQRMAGFLEGLGTADISVPEDLIVRGDFDFDSGERSLSQLRSVASDITAILASSDQQAIGALRACMDAGLAVPADVSIVGFDDIPLARLVNPRLTTVTQSVAGLGARAVELVLRRGEATTARRRRQVVLPVSLTVRESTAPPGLGLVPPRSSRRGRRAVRPTTMEES